MKEPNSIDLDLPSGTLWGDRNIDAIMPFDSGAYFTWGNTDPYYPLENRITDWGNQEDVFLCSFTPINYEETSGHKLNGDIDSEHDAATVNLGKSWRMPTKEEFKELFESCIWKRKSYTTNGYSGISKYNGNTIFLPCCGVGNRKDLDCLGYRSIYLSSSLNIFNTKKVAALYLDEDDISVINVTRYNGFSIRAVKNKHSL